MKFIIIVFTQSIPEKEHRTDNALHQVIGEGHLAYIGKGLHQPWHKPAAVNKQQKACMANAKQNPRNPQAEPTNNEKQDRGTKYDGRIDQQRDGRTTVLSLTLVAYRTRSRASTTIPPRQPV